jgi:diguanylate cyclase (GGDEF)-like protein
MCGRFVQNSSLKLQRDFPALQGFDIADNYSDAPSISQAIGASLLAVANSPDVVARLGGDEFAMVTTHISGGDLERLGRNIQEVFALKVLELGVQATLSIGLVTSDDCPRDQLLADADKALYQSKEAGGNAVRMHKCQAPPTTPELA